MDTKLSAWLRSQLQERNVKAYIVAANTGVGVATMSDILTKGHIPRIDTLIRLADYFHAPREAVLRIAAGLPLAGRPSPQDDDYLIDELLEAFRHIPDEWKQDALAEVESWARHATRPPIHILGAEDDIFPGCRARGRMFWRPAPSGPIIEGPP